MKFRVERDVLADAVAWAARSLPVRPSAPVLAGLLIEAADDATRACVLSTFDYETSARATLNAEVADEGRALVSGRLLADICRSLPDKPVEMAIDGSEVVADLRLGPVQPADDAGRGLPDAARRCPSRDRHRRRASLFAHAVAQAVTAAGRDDMLPVLTGVRIEIDGSTIALLATDRFRLSQPRARPGTPGARTPRRPPWCRPRCSADTAKSLTAGTEVTIALAAVGRRRGHHRLRGLRRPAASVVRRPGCSTASSPRCAACSRTST